MKHINKLSLLYVVALGLLLHSVARCEQSAPVVDEAQIIARVKAMGDGATVDDVLREVSKMPGAGEYDKIHLIEKINTGAARQALLSLTLRQRSDSADGIAADAYVRILPDKRGATNLLQSTDKAVLNSALSGLQGCKVDDDLVKLAKAFLESKNGDMRHWAVDVLIRSPQPLKEEMLVAVVDSMRNIETLPGVTNVVGLSGSFFGAVRNFESKASYEYASYVSGLASTNTSKEMLEKLTPTKAGNMRDVLLIARAKKMDATLKPEMQRVFKESPLNGLRALALKVFCEMATEDDLPFLRDIANNDPACFEPYGEFISQLGLAEEEIRNYKYYPFRRLAKKYVWELAPTHTGRGTPEETGYPSLF
ncbi:MAG: hypothetical protein WCJ07_12395 [Verrucomicrobiota bacterium]